MAPGDYRYVDGNGNHYYGDAGLTTGSYIINWPPSDTSVYGNNVSYWPTSLPAAPPPRDFFWSHGGASHSPPPCLLVHAVAPMVPVTPPAPILPRRTPRARIAARRQFRPVRSRPGARRAAA